MTSVQMVEIVRYKQNKGEGWIPWFWLVVSTALRTLVVWWAVAVWFPELGLTYWQLALPIYALRILILPFDPGEYRLVGNKVPRA